MSKTGPSGKIPVNDQHKPKIAGCRPQNIVCTNLAYSRRFARRAEMLQHVRRDHGAQTTLRGETEGASLACPVPDYHKMYKVQGWLTRHIKSCHPNVVPPEITTGQTKARKTQKQSPSPPLTSGLSTGQYACNYPGCTKRLGTSKGIKNHAYVKHNWSVTRCAPLGEGRKRRTTKNQTKKQLFKKTTGMQPTANTEARADGRQPILPHS